LGLLAVVAIAAAQWTAIVAAGFAAIAAGASWASVWQSRRERIDARTPDMHVEVQHAQDTDAVLVFIASNGGPAKGVYFLVVAGNMAILGHPEPSTLFRPGESRILQTTLQRSAEPPVGFIACHDLAERHLYVWAATGERRVYRIKGLRRDRRDLTDGLLMDELYPGRDISGVIRGDFQTIRQTF
jgi:hypothetical protein